MKSIRHEFWALSDLGALATNAEDQRFKEFWIELGRSYRENGNRAVALVPCLAEQIPDDMARYWHIIPWERAGATQTGGHNSEAIETLLTLLSVAVRLEPELLRSIRQLLPETRDNPGIESLVWQSALVASPNCIAADLDATERKKWISEFAHQAPGLRRAVLKRIRAVVLVPDQRCGTGAEMGAAGHLSDGIARHGRRAIRR